MEQRLEQLIEQCSDPEVLGVVKHNDQLRYACKFRSSGKVKLFSHQQMTHQYPLPLVTYLEKKIIIEKPTSDQQK